MAVMYVHTSCIVGTLCIGIVLLVECNNSIFLKQIPIHPYLVLSTYSILKHYSDCDSEDSDSDVSLSRPPPTPQLENVQSGIRLKDLFLCSSSISIQIF
jgi:hypothetical protein